MRSTILLVAELAGSPLDRTGQGRPYAIPGVRADRRRACPDRVFDIGGRAADMRASSPGTAAVPPEPRAPFPWPEAGRDVLRVTGLGHVLKCLELAEAGALPGLLLLEPFACDGG